MLWAGCTAFSVGYQSIAGRVRLAGALEGWAGMSKKCYRCKQELAVSAFSKRKASADGLNYICKVCYKQAHRPNTKTNYSRKSDTYGTGDIALSKAWPLPIVNGARAH